MTLREKRNFRNLSQFELARLAGITQVALSRIESGQCRPHKSTKKKLEDELGQVDWQQTLIQGIIRNSKYQIIINH